MRKDKKKLPEPPDDRTPVNLESDFRFLNTARRKIEN